MRKTILITGATDGIGLEAAKTLASLGHDLLIHGRSQEKLTSTREMLSSLSKEVSVDSYRADLSNLTDVDALVDQVLGRLTNLDVLINNAGVFKTADPVTDTGLDTRFMVNTIAPFRLTQRLLPIMGSSARILNLSSAAQAPVNIEALNGKVRLDDMDAYAQSKLAITMWSRELANSPDSPIVISVNPGSLLGTKMVKEGFGTEGKDIGIGSNILCRLALEPEFDTASGQYFDNDAGQFGPPHPDALDSSKSAEVVAVIETLVKKLSA